MAETPGYQHLLAAAVQRFGAILHVTGYDEASRYERTVIDAHLADAGLIPLELAERVVAAGLAGVFIGVGRLPDLDDLGFLRATSYEDVNAVYLRYRKFIVAGTIGNDPHEQHNLLHEFGHAIGDLFGLNLHRAVLEYHADVDLWIRLAPFIRGFAPGDARGRRELVAESIRDLILDRDVAIGHYGARHVAFLEAEIGYHEDVPST